MQTRITRLLGTLLCLAMIAWAGSASATGTGFTGFYNPDEWTMYTDGTGYVDTYGAPDYIKLMGSDNGTMDHWGDAAYTTYTTEIVSTGVFNFDWYYESYDYLGPKFDPFGYVHNGDYVSLTDDYGYATQYGWESVHVYEGDTFGFWSVAKDNCCGPSVTKIGKLEYGVPEPSAALLLGIGLGVIGHGTRRRRLV